MVASAFVLMGDFDTLVNWFSVAEWTFYFLAVFGLITMRWTHPDMERPFKYALTTVAFIDVTSCCLLLIFGCHALTLCSSLRVWLIVPITFCAVSLGLMVSLFVQQPEQCGIAMACVALGIPVFYLKEWLVFVHSC